MTKELDYFAIEGGLGWNQHWFSDRRMYVAGCAAVTACDLSIHLARTATGTGSIWRAMRSGRENSL